MDVKVVDASALAAVVFEEPEGPQVSERLRDTLLAAPALLAFEVANVCLTKMRRMPGDRGGLLRALANFEALIIQTHEIDCAAVLSLAERLHLTVYDASYLWLARSLGVELVTLDQQLARAAARA